MQNDFFEIHLINNFPVVSFPRYRPIVWIKFTITLSALSANRQAHERLTSSNL